MPKYINADTFKKYIDRGHLRPPTEICFSELDACNMIDKQPTANVAAIVRCGNCENYEPHIDYQTGKQFNFGYCYHWDYGQGSSPNSVGDDDFCSHGVKRNGEVKK